MEYILTFMSLKKRPSTHLKILADLVCMKEAFQFCFRCLLPLLINYFVKNWNKAGETKPIYSAFVATYTWAPSCYHQCSSHQISLSKRKKKKVKGFNQDENCPQYFHSCIKKYNLYIYFFLLERFPFNTSM